MKRRNLGGQVVAGACISAVVLVGGCGAADTVIPAPPGSAPGTGGSVGGSDWAVRIVGPRELVLSLTGAPPGDGPCGSRLRAVAAESPTQVRLSVVDDRDPGPADGSLVACPAIGHLWSLPVQLAEDLTGREVVDPEGGVLTPAAALEPSHVPSGYVLGGESGGQDHHVLNYGSPDGGWLMVGTWPARGQRAAERAFHLVEERQVDGRSLRLLQNEQQQVVAFDVDGDRVAWVTFMRQRVDSHAELSWDELVAVAESVG